MSGLGETTVAMVVGRGDQISMAPIVATFVLGGMVLAWVAASHCLRDLIFSSQDFSSSVRAVKLLLS